jgi:hypothetical protein
MLSNIVGTLLAFVTIMLMLSLIVTSLVQFTQASLRLRGRNLIFGIAAVLRHHYQGATEASSSALRSDPHKALAAKVLNSTQTAVKYLPDPNSTGRVIVGPPISWVNSDDLASAVAKVIPSANPPVNPVGVSAAAGQPQDGSGSISTPPLGSSAGVKKTFEDMEPALSKRFQFIMRIWTVLFSFAIAFVFQLSTPDLLKTLPSAEAKRQAILAAVPSLTNDATRNQAFSTDTILEESLARLGKSYPQYKQLFEEVSGEYESKQEMIDELRGVLGKRADREAVLREYASIIDSLSESAASAAYANSSRLIEQLDSFGISPKLDNFDFFASTPTADAAAHREQHGVAPETVNSASNSTASQSLKIHWTNIVGVLITGILLSLGAPFWFTQLKNLSSLRDGMDPSSVAAKAK